MPEEDPVALAVGETEALLLADPEELDEPLSVADHVWPAVPLPVSVEEPVALADKAEMVLVDVAEEQRDTEAVADVLPVTVGAPDALPVALPLPVAQRDAVAVVVPVPNVDKVALHEALPVPDTVATPLAVAMALHDADAVDERDERLLDEAGIVPLEVADEQRETGPVADAEPVRVKSPVALPVALLLPVAHSVGEVDEELLSDLEALTVGEAEREALGEADHV